MRWEIKLTQDVLHTPAVGPEGTVYLGDRGGSLHAIRPDGTGAWSVQQASPFSSSAPVVRSDGSILIADFDGGPQCFAPDGTRRWRVIHPGSVTGTPALADDGRIRVLYSSGFLRCLNENGSPAWQHQFQGQLLGASPAVDGNGTTYVSTFDAGLLAVGPNGQRLWSREVSGGITSTPVLIASGTLVVPGHERQVLFYGTNGVLSGQVSVELRLSGDLTITPSGLVLAMSGTGELYAIQTDLRIQGSHAMGRRVQPAHQRRVPHESVRLAGEFGEDRLGDVCRSCRVATDLSECRGMDEIQVAAHHFLERRFRPVLRVAAEQFGLF
ncbi:MAG: PQQ-binding-like beta-propeller repeat protein [Verrucomicrobiota bacterium]